MTSKEKTLFRGRKVWKDFKARLLKERGLTCELTGTKLTARTANIHHLRPAEYDNLDPDLFKILSPDAHYLVEKMTLILRGKTEVPRRAEWLALLDGFLPEKEEPEWRKTKIQPVIT